MSQWYSEIDWNVRYPANWSELRRRAKRATKGKCCLCKEAKAKEVHHSRYLGIRDTPGVNLFPVCLSCHKLCHAERNWFKHKGNPLWKSCNLPHWEARLKAGYQELSQKSLKA